MVSKMRAVLNTFIFSLPLFFGLVYSALFGLALPESVIVPTAGGGLMNIGFWAFYNSSVGSIPGIERILSKNRHMFLFSAALHFAVILVLLVYDVSWIPEILGF